MKTPHLAIIHLNSIPPITFSEFSDVVATQGLELRIDAREDGGIFAGLEWLLPTAVIAYIGKSYFDGFLSEMGKDHYSLLKLGLLQLRSRMFGESAPKISLIGSEGKASDSQPYSHVFSVLAEVEQCHTLKLLIQENVSEEDYLAIIEAFLDFLSALHSDSVDNEVIERIQRGKTGNSTLLFAFNLETKTLVAVDPITKETTSIEWLIRS